MDEILKYFPDLSDRQKEQVEVMLKLYPVWNDRINVVSRRDIENLAERHILHSLSIARFLQPVDGTTFMDLGCGGGFPGLPLAILWPNCRFHLIDRIAKKLRVAEDIALQAGITNVSFQHGDSSECHEKFDYVVSRAVMSLDKLVDASRRNVAQKTRSGNLHNGLLCLKGGDLADEIAAVKSREVIEVPLSDYFCEEFFQTKSLVYIPL